MFFSKKNWDTIPGYAKDYVRNLLSEEDFKYLTEMSIKYNVFPQMKNIFKDYCGEPQKPFEMKMGMQINTLMTFFTNVGNAVCVNNMNDKAAIKEATIFTLTALAMKPDHWPALSDLAIESAMLGNKKESKKYAKKAISEMDKESDLEDEYKSLRNLLSDLEQGNLENFKI